MLYVFMKILGDINLWRGALSFLLTAQKRYCPYSNFELAND